MTLQKWQADGLLKPHRTSRQEIAELLEAADQDLADCETPGLSAMWRLNIAYNAALRCATAALAASGYRPAQGESHHLRTIQSLAHTVGLDAVTVRQLDGFRKKRNVSAYDRIGMVSDLEAAEMAALAKTLRVNVERWLRKHHPDLM
ncbi:MAG TPA: hypothetical protein VNA25_20240 [Phycisphaerae bacterium]|nr:hypothetical protein [Phycisphaerae bacterium]